MKEEEKNTYVDSIVFKTFDLKIKKESEVSTASLDNVKKYITSAFGKGKQPDLMPVVFNLAVVNSFNKKGEGIASNTAVAILDNFAHRPTNIEHENKEIVGHVAEAYFTDIENEKIMSKEEAYNTDKPFYITILAYVYKMIFPGFAELLEKASEEGHSLYKKISASWEIGYKTFDIAVGSNDLNECFIISAKDPRFEDYKKMLKKFKGRGFDKNDNQVNLLVTGDAYPLGVGFTTSPAANVEGVAIYDEEEEEQKSIELEKQVASEISHKDKNDVIFFNKTNKNDMDAKELVNLLEEKLKDKEINFSEKTIASMTTFINDKIRERDEQFKAEKEQLEQQKLEASRLAEEKEKTLLDVQSKLEIAQEQIQEMKASIEKKEKADAFNNRMNLLDDEFDFSEDDRKIIASEIKDLDVTEESFAKYKNKVDVIFKEKNKAYKKEKEKEMQAKIDAEVEKRTKEKAENKKEEMQKSKASTESDSKEEEKFEEAFDKAEASEKSPVNNNAESTDTKEALVDRLRANFSKGIKTQY